MSSLRTKGGYLLKCHISSFYEPRRKKKKNAANYTMTHCLVITGNFHFVFSEWALLHLLRNSF